MISRRPSPLATSRTAAEIGFYVLFPGFFFYHLGVTSGFIPNVAGGLFGPVTVILTVIFILSGPQILTTYLKAGKVVLLLFALLFMYCSTWFLLHHYTTSVPYRDEAAEQLLGLLFAWLALFMMGVVLPAERNRFRRSLMVWICLMALTTFSLFDTENMMFNPRVLYDVSDGVATYQGYARSGLMTAVLLLGMCSTFRSEVLVVFPSTLLLFLLGARSELFGFVALAGVLFVLESVRSIKRIFVLLCLLVASGAFVLYHIDDFMASRQSQVLDIDQATSWQARREYQAIAVRQILEHPLIGVYAGHFEAGGKGAYAHNVSSAWVTFGVAGFVLYFGLTIYCTILSFNKYLREPRGASTWRLVLCVNFVGLLLILIAKPVYWTVPALGWGLVVNSLLREQLFAEAKRRRYR